MLLLVVFPLMLSFTQVFKPASAVAQVVFCASTSSSQADNAAPAALRQCATIAGACQPQQCILS
jgi:hypothetical protein